MLRCALALVCSPACAVAHATLPSCWLLQVLQRLSFADHSVRETLLAQGRILLFYYFLTFHILKSKKPKYQPLLAPAKQPASDAGKAAEPVAAV